MSDKKEDQLDRYTVISNMEETYTDLPYVKHKKENLELTKAERRALIKAAFIYVIPYCFLYLAIFLAGILLLKFFWLS